MMIEYGIAYQRDLDNQAELLHRGPMTLEQAEQWITAWIEMGGKSSVFIIVSRTVSDWSDITNPKIDLSPSGCQHCGEALQDYGQGGAPYCETSCCPGSYYGTAGPAKDPKPWVLPPDPAERFREAGFISDDDLDLTPDYTFGGYTMEDILSALLSKPA